MKYLIKIVLILLLTSCNEPGIDSNANFPKDGVVRISTSVIEQLERATTPYLGTNLSLSLEYGSGDEEFSRQNLLWTNFGGNWTTEIPAFWRDGTTPLRLYAYAPHVEAVTDLTMIPFLVDLDQNSGLTKNDLLSFIDLNFIPNANLNSNQALSLNFTHKLSKLSFEFQIRGQAGASTSVFVESVMVHAKREILYNAETGVSTLIEQAPFDITPFKDQSGNFSLILPPQNIAAETKLFTITLNNGDVFYYNVPAGGHAFESNSSYNVKLTLGNDGVQLDNIVVSDWVTGPVIEDELEKEELITLKSDLNSDLFDVTGKNSLVIKRTIIDLTPDYGNVASWFNIDANVEMQDVSFTNIVDINGNGCHYSSLQLMSTQSPNTFDLDGVMVITLMQNSKQINKKFAVKIKGSRSLNIRRVSFKTDLDATLHKVDQNELTLLYPPLIDIYWNNIYHWFDKGEDIVMDAVNITGLVQTHGVVIDEGGNVAGTTYPSLENLHGHAEVKTTKDGVMLSEEYKVILEGALVRLIDGAVQDEGVKVLVSQNRLHCKGINTAVGQKVDIDLATFFETAQAVEIVNISGNSGSNAIGPLFNFQGRPISGGLFSVTKVADRVRISTTYNGQAYGDCYVTVRKESVESVRRIRIMFNSPDLPAPVL